MNRASVLLLIGLTVVSGASTPIRYEPRVVDVHFAFRQRLCPDAPASGGMGVANDQQRSVAEFLGPALREIVIHQVGDSLVTFTRVREHVEEVLARRPHGFSRYTPWAEGTPLATGGILGTLRYRGNRTGQLEISGLHLCFQDSTGVVWWARVAPVDRWP